MTVHFEIKDGKSRENMGDWLHDLVAGMHFPAKQDAYLRERLTATEKDRDRWKRVAESLMVRRRDALRGGH